MCSYVLLTQVWTYQICLKQWFSSKIGKVLINESTSPLYTLLFLFVKLRWNGNCAGATASIFNCRLVSPAKMYHPMWDLKPQLSIHAKSYTKVVSKTINIFLGRDRQTDILIGRCVHTFTRTHLSSHQYGYVPTYLPTCCMSPFDSNTLPCTKTKLNNKYIYTTRAIGEPMPILQIVCWKKVSWNNLSSFHLELLSYASAQ